MLSLVLWPLTLLASLGPERPGVAHRPEERVSFAPGSIPAERFVESPHHLGKSAEEATEAEETEEEDESAHLHRHHGDPVTSSIETKLPPSSSSPPLDAPSARSPRGPPVPRV